ncbi:hypothetical protein EV11_1747 [Prochlorococcus sp. SS52]|nr:hypothetical protein EV04_1905 [Prochlorococcus marinus str. LG]KGG20525.1 hypothetical protein EV08_1111 [Prochlorococcus marinus str. SS2]KGG24190.1 hypothetical protein EV09_0797 [Prochlorococcus marinus str. SS35]KGG34618.1 hypothetical protein EV11_1747 [Prochlorococcus sp. SS52]
MVTLIKEFNKSSLRNNDNASELCKQDGESFMSLKKSCQA